MSGEWGLCGTCTNCKHVALLMRDSELPVGLRTLDGWKTDFPCSVPPPFPGAPKPAVSEIRAISVTIPAPIVKFQYVYGSAETEPKYFVNVQMAQSRIGLRLDGLTLGQAEELADSIQSHLNMHARQLDTDLWDVLRKPIEVSR